MDPILGAALISGAFGIGGSLLGARSQDKTNAANAALAKETRDWEERMSNTAHQRAVTDLRAAGLNPLLALNNGASMPNVQAAHLESPGKHYAEAGSSAGAIALNRLAMKQNIATAKSQEVLNSAGAVKAAEEARRVGLESDVLETRRPVEQWKNCIEQYKQEERYKSRSWDLMLDDVKRGITSFNPFIPKSSVSEYSR